MAQRFGSALNLNLHFHALVLDGVYASPDPFTRPHFHPAAPLTERDVEEVTLLLHRRITRYLVRHHLRCRDTLDDGAEPDEPLLAELQAASVQGRGAPADRGEPFLGPLRPRRDARPTSMPGELCASIGGFSLHAKVRLDSNDYDGRERLARYLARPAIASERLSLDAHGRVVYRLRRHWKDGTRAVVFDPGDLIARLAALVPRPRAHLLTYHGVLAPAAEWRDWIVPAQPLSIRSDPSASLAAKALRPKSRASWPELLKRTFEIDVLTCLWCGGKRELIALITDGKVVRASSSTSGFRPAAKPRSGEPPRPLQGPHRPVEASPTRPPSRAGSRARALRAPIARYRAFIARLHQVREEAGLTQVEVARGLGRQQTWVSKCELGERRVDFVELEDWAAACRKPLEWFRTKGRP